MIKIGQIHSHLGEGVWSMIHVSCVDDDRTEFLVNSRPLCSINFDPSTELVECPWCHVKVALSIILENYTRNHKIEEWSEPKTLEEQK